MKNYKIAVAGTGYVGLSLGVLFAQHHQVVAVDIVQAKVDMINNKKSPIQDDYIEKYLAEKDLNLTATLDAKAAWKKWHKKKNTRLGERIQEIFSTRRVFHSAGMCLLEAEGFYPCGQVGFAGIGIEYLTMQQFCTGAARRKFFIGLTHVAAARCGKGDDCFTFQIIAFQKRIDNRRSNIPPDRESDKDGVVFVHVITLGSDGRARSRIAHFDGAAGFLIHPVQIGFCVRDFGTDFKNVCTDGIC